MTRKNTLNNMTLDNLRKTREYQAVITDLALEGIISLDVAESLLGYEIPEYLHSPSGKQVERKKAATQKKESSKKKEDKASETLFEEEGGIKRS